MKLISLNIEGNRHLNERIFPFLQAENPDTCCFQEVFACDVEHIIDALGPGWEHEFAPMSNAAEDNPHLPNRGQLGLLIASRHPMHAKYEYYVGGTDDLPIFFSNQNPNGMNRALLQAQLQLDGKQYTIVTTHFTWSPQGKVTPEQERDFARMLAILHDWSAKGDLIFCGDLNTPRGNALYSKLQEQLTDHIPAHVTTTIDSNLHKSGNKIELVVDGLFSTTGYDLQNVRIVDGVSDHMAIVAKVQHV